MDTSDLDSIVKNVIDPLKQNTPENPDGLLSDDPKRFKNKLKKGVIHVVGRAVINSGFVQVAGSVVPDDCFMSVAKSSSLKQADMPKKSRGKELK